MQLDDMIKLIERLERSRLTDFEYSKGDEKIVIRRKERKVMQAASPDAAAVTAEQIRTPDTPAESGEEEDLYEVKAPYAGTVIYTKDGKGREAKAGDRVEKGKLICQIEAMKVYTNIESEYDGEIVSVKIKQGEIAEFGQTILTVRKSMD